MHRNEKQLTDKKQAGFKFVFLLVSLPVVFNVVLVLFFALFITGCSPHYDPYIESHWESSDRKDTKFFTKKDIPIDSFILPDKELFSENYVIEVEPGNFIYHKGKRSFTAELAYGKSKKDSETVNVFIPFLDETRTDYTDTAIFSKDYSSTTEVINDIECTLYEVPEKKSDKYILNGTFDDKEYFISAYDKDYVTETFENISSAQ